MKAVNIYRGREGWFYEVWMSSRLIVFGWCSSRERAELRAAFT